MCCTGGGCPSYRCNSSEYNVAVVCDGSWTCCQDFPDPCNRSVCTPTVIYETLGTCRSCDTGDDGGGTTTTYGKFLGRIFTDLDSSGWQNGAGELWSNTATTCSGLKHDSFNISYNSANIGATWACNTDGAFYTTGNVAIGTNKSVTLVGLPPNYNDCSNVTWTYSTTGTTANSKSGSGCTASGLTVVKDTNNHLWWQLRPSNHAPTLSIVPPSVSFSGYARHPLKVVAADADLGGSLKISTSLSPPNNGNLPAIPAIEFVAYGSTGDGIWPIANIYGWNKNTGNRELIKTYIVNTTTPTSYWFDLPYPAYTYYTFFDLEFPNDYYGGPGKDVNLYVDSLTYHYDNMFYSDPYKIQAEDANLVQYDRGDSDDGYDLISPSTLTAVSPGATYSVMAWSGALRFPVIWQSPTTALSGSITFTVTDNAGASLSKSVPTTPVTGTVTGKVWITADPSVCTASHTPLLTASGVVVTTRAGDTYLSAPLSSGQYSIGNLFGSISSLCLSGTPATPAYRIACRNNEPVSATTGLCDYISPSLPGTGTTTIDIGIRPITAKGWVAAMGSDVYAKDILVSLPPFYGCPGWNYWGVCPTFTDTTKVVDHYVLGYNPWVATPASSSIFTEDDVSLLGPSLDELSESGVSATKLGSKFRAKNKQYFNSLHSLIDTLKNTSTYNVVSSLNNVTLAKNSITIWDKGVSNIPATTSYTVTEGLAFLVIPRDGPISKAINILDKISTTGAGRLVILADRDVNIGISAPGFSTNNLKITSATIQASIITTGNVTVNNYLSASSSAGTVIIEGPLIIGGTDGMTINRSLGTDNEFRPAVFVRYNPLYITKLNELAMKNTVPALNPLFTFDFTSDLE